MKCFCPYIKSITTDNGREFFPKKTDLSKISHGEVFDVVDSINKHHLKVLNWETAD